MKGRRLRLVLWCLAVLCAGMIFAFSSQTGSASQQTSSKVVEWILPIAAPNYEQMPLAQRQEVYQHYQYLVRKAAHFLEFALLGFLIRLALGSRSRHLRSLWAWMGATGYAALDEFHQLFVGERSGMWRDVCLDSTGALTGVLLAAGILALWRRNKKSV